MVMACVPAHAAYFSIYESAKPRLQQHAGPVGAGAAVALGTMAHDIIMTPMDVCKQRLQLGAPPLPPPRTPLIFCCKLRARAT